MNRAPGKWDGHQSQSVDLPPATQTCTLETRSRDPKMVFLTTKVMQRTALFVTFGGLVTSLVTTFLPFWKTMNSDLNEVENWFSGLWHTCLYTEEVGIQCKAFDSIMGLPMDLQISRVLMSVSVCTGSLALLVVLPGLEGVQVCLGQPLLKRKCLVVGGLLSWVSGLTTLAPVSVVAYTTVVEFWDEGFSDVMPRWEYGEAMFSGWFGGLALLVGGTLFFVAVCMEDFERRPPSVSSSPQAMHRMKNYLKTEVL